MSVDSSDSITRLLGLRVRRWRMALGYSQEKLAECAGLHRTYIGTVERGEQNITVANAEKIANALHITLSDILGTQQLREFYELFPGSFSIMNPEGKVIAWNPFMRDVIAALPEEEMYGIDGMATVHPDDRAFAIEQFSAILLSGNEITGEARVLLNDGPEYVWRSISGRRIEVDGEACVLALGIDITEHKRLDAVRTYTDQLFSMDESVSVDVLLQTALNAAEEITESSTGFCHFIGDERIGDQPAQIWSSNAARMLEHAGIVSARRDHLNSSDIWKDIIESKQAVIHNDAASIRKIRGIPSDAPSHISRELLIPLKKSGQVAAIFGVANKPFNYTDDDVAIVTRIASLMWNVVSRRIAEETVRRIKSSVEPKAAIRSGHSSRPHTRHGS